MKTLQKLAVVAISMLSATLFAAEASAQTAKPAEARNVVLVHGAWADGSSWTEVIARLQAAGLHVTAVQNPLTSLADSVAATRRALALQDVSNISRTVSRTKRQKSFMPNKNPPPPLCSAGEPQWRLGAPNRAGMQCRNSIRRSRLTWNDF